MIDFIIGFCGALGCLVAAVFCVFLVAWLVVHHPDFLNGLIVALLAIGICCIGGYTRMKKMRG